MSRFEDEGYQAEQRNFQPTYQIVHEELERGETLIAKFPSMLDEDQVLDLGKFLYLERNFAIAFAHAFATWNLSHEPVTRRGNCVNLNDGFIYWVEQNYESQAIGFPQFELDLFDKWDKWLTEKDEVGEYYVSPSTLHHYRSAIRGVIEALKLGDWRDKVHENCRLRKGILAKKKIKKKTSNPTTFILSAEFLQLSGPKQKNL